MTNEDKLKGIEHVEAVTWDVLVRLAKPNSHDLVSVLETIDLCQRIRERLEPERVPLQPGDFRCADGTVIDVGMHMNYLRDNPDHACDIEGCYCKMWDEKATSATAGDNG